MKIETNIENILDLMDRPAFCVEGGVIREANQAALARMIVPGTEVGPLITAGRLEYEAFSVGCLYLTLTVGGTSCGATVTRLGESDVFSLENTDEDPELRAYALAAQELRQPLSQMLTISDQLFPSLESAGSPLADEQIARLYRSMHQMLRVVSNMSDAVTAGVARMELRDVTAVVQEILDHAAPLCQGAGVQLRFTNHPATIYSLVDSQKLERAIYNLLSNALKHTASGGCVDVQLKRRGNSIYLTVTDPGSGEGTPLSVGMFDRFLREPGIAGSQNGLGLGLVLVRAAARAHSGTLLLTPQTSGGTLATLSFPIRQESTSLRSPTVRIDYAGERDHGLIELSGSLPLEFYTLHRD